MGLGEIPGGSYPQWLINMAAESEPSFKAQKITDPCTGNKFSNDGSFLEMFKRKMAEKNGENVQENETTDSSKSTSSQSFNSTNKSSNHRLKTGALPLVSYR